MKKPTVIFGWRNVIYNYGWKGFLLDSILPVMVSAFLSVTMYMNGSDVFLQLKHLIEVGLDVVPAMVALIFAAYAILLTFLTGEMFRDVKGNENGKDLIKRLNSGFAACLSISSVTLIVLIVVSCIANMDIGVACHYFVDYPVFAVISYLLVYSVFILMGIVIDIFNCGQTTLLDKKCKEED